ncbi:MAG: 4Fe-4S binding protein, partial [Clostridiales bacterium]|nr:4Fe-4S binding protein [Clostridiales bacterium]
ATGGVASAEDVLEFILAGADLVQMLSSAVINGRKIYDEIIDKLPKVMEKYDIESIESLRKTELDIKPQGIGGNPIIDHDKCTKCMLCVRICPEAALSFTDKIEVDKNICMKCGLCESRCPVEAIRGVL